jgi:serine/threonine-protein kinase
MARLPDLGDILARMYLLERRVGSGAMGTVFAGRHLVLDTHVAIKVMRPRADGSAGAERFLREARIAARLRSLHAVRALDFDQLEDGLQFLVMELLEGEDLGALLMRRGRCEIAESVDVVVQACDALAEAHTLGVVHRDLKPRNLFACGQPDGEALVKVLDFGVAKPPFELGDARTTAASSLVGSPPYMAPEQIRCARDVDARADIWSLGVILYELLSGARPFQGDGLEDLLMAISAATPPSLRARRAEVPEEVERVIGGCLEKARSARIGDALELARRLAPFGGASCVLRVAGMTARLASGARGEASSPAAPATGPENAGSTWSMTDTSDGVTVTTPPSETPEPPPSRLGPRGRAEGGRRIGRFDIERALDERGAVWVGLGADGTRVAVKLLAAGLANDPAGRMRCLAAHEAAFRLSNRHVVRTLEVGMDASLDTPFVAMDLLRGEDLEQALSRGPLRPEIAVALCLQAAEGLAAVHAHGMVHRDVKPSNLFLHEEDDGRVTVKLCDFDIAKLPGDAGPTGPSAIDLRIVGSPAYIAPEQLRSPDEVDARADVWSLCVTLYQALSGRTPWADVATPAELPALVRDKDAVGVEVLAPWVDRSLAGIVQRGLARDPAARHRDGAELGAALRDWLGPSTPHITRASVDEPWQPIGSARSGAALPARPRRVLRSWLALVPSAGAVALVVAVGLLRARPVVTEAPSTTAPASSPAASGGARSASPAPSLAEKDSSNADVTQRLGLEDSRGPQPAKPRTARRPLTTPQGSASAAPPPADPQGGFDRASTARRARMEPADRAPAASSAPLPVGPNPNPIRPDLWGQD